MKEYARIVHIHPSSFWGWPKEKEKLENQLIIIERLINIDDIMEKKYHEEPSNGYYFIEGKLLFERQIFKEYIPLVPYAPYIAIYGCKLDFNPILSYKEKSELVKELL